MKRKQKITFETVKHLSTKKIEQRLFSYIDFMKKNNYILIGLPYRLYIKIQILKEEYFRRLEKMKNCNVDLIKEAIWYQLYSKTLKTKENK
jgi:hypothetical protein